jgi:putative Mg2+ transporter-C (MgtC) family protein
MTTAIGMACGAGLTEIAVVATAGHLLVVVGYQRLLAVLPRSRHVGFDVRVVYADGRGILRTVLAQTTALGFSIAHVATRQLGHVAAGLPAVEVTLELRGQPSAHPLTVALSEIDGVLEVDATDHAPWDEASEPAPERRTTIQRWYPPRPRTSPPR